MCVCVCVCLCVKLSVYRNKVDVRADHDRGPGHYSMNIQTIMLHRRCRHAPIRTALRHDDGDALK
jgi:hypothetical protein